MRAFRGPRRDSGESPRAWGVRGEFVRSTKTGATVVVKAKWSLRKDPEGNPIDIVETSRDITEIRRSEEAFARMRYQYQNLFQASVASFWELEFSAVTQLLRSFAGVRRHRPCAILQRQPGLRARDGPCDAHPGWSMNAP